MVGSQPAQPPGAFGADRLAEDRALAEDSARRPRGPRHQWPSVLILAGLALSLAIVAADHFRRGSVLFAGFVVLAFLLRLLLSDRRAGWLAVRSRPIDLLWLGGLGLALTVFALIVPSPS